MHKSIETLLPMDSPEQKVDDQAIGEVRPLGTASGHATTAAIALATMAVS
jgi:hypothetical protein